MSLGSGSRAKAAAEFRKFLRDFRGQCQCGATYRLKSDQVTVVDASMGAASYRIHCPSCGRMGIGVFGPPEFVQYASAHFDGFCAGLGLAEPDVQVSPGGFGGRPGGRGH